MEIIQKFWPWVLEHPKDAPFGQFLLVSIIAFVVVIYFVIKLIPGPMIRSILEERRTAIAHSADQVESTLRETEQMRGDYQRRLEGIQSETERRMADAVTEAGALRDAILEDARKVAASIVRRGQEEAERERAKMVVAMRATFVDDAIRAAEYAAANSLDSNAQKRLIQEFVQNVGSAS